MLFRILQKISILFFCITSAHAAPSDELLQLLHHIQSMQANFTQIISDSKGKKINRTSGEMALARPGKFRWHTLHPNTQLIVTNGKKLWIYDPDLEQVTIRYLTKETGETPALLLTKTNTTLTKDFYVETVKDSSSLHWFLLLPRDKSSMFEAIRLGFANESIQKMQLQDHLGQVTTIEFDHVVVNSTLPSELFIFKPTGKVDIIDESA